VIGQAVREEPARDIYADAERQRLGTVMLAKADALAGSNPETRAVSKRLVAAQSRPVIETYSTPWLYTLFGLVSVGNYDRDQSFYLYFSLLCQVLAVAAMTSLLGFPPAAGALAVAFSVGWFAPSVSDMYVGNVNRLLLASLALFLWVEHRSRWKWRHGAGGFVLGCAVMFKPNLGFVALALLLGWLVFKRSRKLLHVAIGMAAAGAFSIAVSGWYFHSFRPWLLWARELPRLMGGYDHAVTRGNFSLDRLLRDMFGGGVASLLPVIFITIIVGSLIQARRNASKPESIDIDPEETGDLRWDMFLISLGSTISLLVSQLAWQHYFVLTIPVVLYLFRPGGGTWEPGSKRRWILLAHSVAASFLIAQTPLKSLLGWEISASEAAWFVSSGTLSLFVLTLLDPPAVRV
jgi:hypothetical protein